MSTDRSGVCIAVSVRRLGLPATPKLGGFDSIVNDVIDTNTMTIFIELPLESPDEGRLRIGRRGQGLEVTARSSAHPLSQLSMLFGALRCLMRSPKPRIWASADVSLAPIARLLRGFGIVQVWYQHFPDFTPPRSRFANSLASAIYTWCLKLAWQKADIVTAPSERIGAALVLECDSQREDTLIISNQLSPDDCLRMAEDALVPCNCSRTHVLMATSSTDAKFCMDEVIQGVQHFDSVHLLVTGLVTGPYLDLATVQSSSVSFLGLLSDLQVRGIAQRCAFGLALYRMDPSDHANFGDSLKIRLYADEGLPVIASARVSPAAEIAAAGGAVLIDDPHEWVNSLDRVLNDREMSARMSAAAKSWAQTEKSLRARHLRDLKCRINRAVSGQD